jgi:hypothetical protein
LLADFNIFKRSSVGFSDKFFMSDLFKLKRPFFCDNQK